MTLAAIAKTNEPLPHLAPVETEPAPATRTGAAPAADEPARKAPPRARAARLTPGTLRELGLAGASLLIGLAAWHYATANDLQGLVNFTNVPGPAEVWGAFLRNVGDPTFHTHLLVSIQRVAISFALAAAVGIVFGLLMGRIPFVRATVMPYVEVLRPIPAVAWIPLAILMWPTEEASIVYITFLGAVFPIILNAMHGAEQTPEVLVRAVRSLGATRASIFWHVVLPAALPSIAAGLAIGMGVAWFSLLAGEIISGQYGIGYFTWDAYSMVQTPDIVVGMLVIGLLGSLSTYLVRFATSPFLRWREKAR